MSQFMSYRGITIEDTYAEAFTMRGTRLVITAASRKWVGHAVEQLTGYGTSVIACDAEVGVETWLNEQETPDGRSGASVLLFGFGKDGLQKAVLKRVGQCILTCATTACFNGVAAGEAGKDIEIGKQLRYFGDGFQISKKLDDRRLWRIPVMDGEFLCDAMAGTFSGIGGGNLMLAGKDPQQCLEACEAAVDAIQECPGVMTPFPGGIVRSGSKVGSRYPTLKASTNDAFCPTLKTMVKSQLPADANCCYEIVIDGVDYASIQQAMKAGLHAAIDHGGIQFVSAGNYGGKLGPHHFRLVDLLDETPN
jgi:formylmethanofuran--tetrahydromethanopterin N-formyltransferase